MSSKVDVIYKREEKTSMGGTVTIEVHASTMFSEHLIKEIGELVETEMTAVAFGRPTERKET